MGISLRSSSGQQAIGSHDGAPAIGGEGEPQSHSKKYTYKYKTLQDYFLQDDPSTDAGNYDFMTTNFGLKDGPYDSDESLPNEGRDVTQWQRFEHHISSLNSNAQLGHNEDKRTARRHDSSPRTRYILFFLGRHGNGYHNIAERYYGNIAWDCHFCALDGDPDDIMDWADAHLTKEGRRQAGEVNAFWRNQTSREGQKMSLPEVCLVSPLDRTLETAQISFEGLGQNGGELQAIVMEKVREGTGIHTCDRRSSVSHIRGDYPSYNFDLDPKLTEEDQYWDAARREPDSVLDQRLRRFFDDLMRNTALSEGKERISITSHSGAIGAMLRVLGHRQFSLGTGAVIPVFVEVQRIGIDDADHINNDKQLTGRHGGGGEGAGHEDPTLDLPDLDGQDDATDIDSNDRSNWQPIPTCPANLDLSTVGQRRWGMGLKDFLEGVENETIDVNAVPFGSTG